MSFCFFHYLLLKEDGMLSSNKSHNHPKLFNLIWTFYSYWNILGKQLSQVTSCSNQGLQIASYIKISNIFYETKYDNQVVRYLPKSEAPDSRLQEKAYPWVCFLNELACLEPKKDSCIDFFLWKKFGWWLLPLNTIFFVAYIPLPFSLNWSYYCW